MSQWNPFEKLYDKLIAELATISIQDVDYDKTTRQLIDTVRRPTVLYVDGNIFISAEDGCHFADYYGEFRNDHGDPWIHEKLEAWAKEKGYRWEWENPGAIRLTQ